MKTDVNQIPQSLQEMIYHYSDKETCFKAMVAFRWPSGHIACPRCGCVETWFIKTRMVWDCRGCKKQFSVKVGTIFEDSPLALSKWLPAVWLIVNAKNGISSCELARSLRVTQKTAWFMLHRIREALNKGTFMKSPDDKIGGIVMADETYIGGLEKNKHADKRTKNAHGNNAKSVVVALLERDGQARVKRVPSASKAEIFPFIKENVRGGSQIHTDASTVYQKLPYKTYDHEFVDHAIQYVKENVHTNGLENYFSLLKRTIKGTYVAINPEHLQAYLDEQNFRFNHRKMTDAERFAKTLGMVNGKRLTYKELTSAYVAYFDEMLPVEQI